MKIEKMLETKLEELIRENFELKKRIEELKNKESDFQAEIDYWLKEYDLPLTQYNIDEVAQAMSTAAEERAIELKEEEEEEEEESPLPSNN